MSEPAIRTEIVDLAALRHRGTPAEKEAMAKRIFALWQPIFSHLDALDWTFHLKKHVEDDSAVQIRGQFGIDANGRDCALLIVRVHEHVSDGRSWARLTINAGFSPDMVQRHFGQDFIMAETWRYRLRHPRRPFFVVDCAVSPASYCAYAKTYLGMVPAPDRPTPQAWWPMAEVGVAALGGLAVAGARREVRRFPAAVRDPNPRRAGSVRARRGAQFFSELTGDVPGHGVLVMAPLTFPAWSATTLAYLVLRSKRKLGI